MSSHKLAVWFSIFLLFASQASALSFVSFSGANTPTQVYETTDANFTFQVSNGLFSLNSVDNVTIGVNGFNILSVIALNGWTSSGAIEWFTTTNAISNWGVQNYGFTAKANNVASDTTYNWAVVTTDNNYDQSVFTYQVTVLNDNTPPVMSNITPVNGTFNKGSNSELFSMDSVDPETGVANSNVYKSVNCTGNYTQTSLSSSGSNWFANLDLSADPEGVQDCYYFDSTNNGGATGATPVYFIIPDRTAPTVSLNNPANGSLINSSNVTFDFTATDNLATSLSCALTVDSNQTQLTTYGQTLYNLALADGQHTWNVACTDGAGWSTTTETRSLIVDTQGPQINITQAQTTFRGSSVPLSSGIVDAGVGTDASTVTFTVTDPSSGTSNVPVTQNGNIFSGSYATTISSELGTYQLLVNAADLIGNAASAVMNFILTYSYLLGITAAPTQVSPSVLSQNITYNVTVNGTVTYDNGSSVPENSLTLSVPDTSGTYTTVSANIANDQFTYTFTSPEIPGSYVITASITAQNNYTFTSNATVFVGQFCGDTSCNNGESCGSCSQDCGACPPPSPGGGGGGGGPSGGSNSGGPAPFVGPGSGSNAVVPYVEKKKAEPEAAVDNSASQPVQVSSNVPQPVQPVPETPGIGFGFALFSKIKAKWYVIAMIATLLITLYIFGWRKREKSDELADYIARRTKYRDW